MKKPTPHVFTIVELIVVVAIMAILISMLVPALNQAKLTAQSLCCVSNLKQLGLAIASYASDFNGFLPPSELPGSVSYRAVLERDGYMPMKKSSADTSAMFYCPSAKPHNEATWFLDYSANLHLMYRPGGNTWYWDTTSWGNMAKPLDNIQMTPSVPVSTSTRMLLMDSFGMPSIASPDYYRFRHNKQANILYVDSHVAPRGLPPGFALAESGKSIPSLPWNTLGWDIAW